MATFRLVQINLKEAEILADLEGIRDDFAETRVWGSALEA